MTDFSLFLRNGNQSLQASVVYFINNQHVNQRVKILGKTGRHNSRLDRTSMTSYQRDVPDESSILHCFQVIRQ